MGVKANIIPEDIQDIYNRFKDIAIKKGMINKDAPVEKIQEGFMEAIKDKKMVKAVANTINSNPNISKTADINAKIKFLKENGVEIKLTDDCSISQAKRFVNKKLREVENKLYNKRQTKNKELQDQLKKALEKVKK